MNSQKFDNVYNINKFDENIDYFLNKIDDLDECSKIFSSNKKVLNSIYPNYTNLDKEYLIKNFTEHSPFEVSFTFEDEYFPRIRVSKIYINSFLNLYYMFKEIFDLSKLKNINYFRPIFIDKKLNIAEHGRSERFILCQEDDININENELKFLRKHFSYGKSVFISKQKVSSLLSNEFVQLDSIQNLKDTLKNVDFNACYIIGFSYEEIIEELEQENQELTLF